MSIVKVNNIDVYFIKNNYSHNKNPVVFIHGAGNTSYTWYNQLSINLTQYYPLVVDLPGHVRSSGEGFNEIERYSEFILSFIDTLRLEHVVLSGHSMGGAIALDFALKYPNRLNRLILIGTGAKLRVAKEVLENTKKGFSYSYYAYSLKTDKSLFDLAEKEFPLTDPIVRYNDFVACNSFSVMDKINMINVDTLVIVGRDDQLTPVKYAEFLTREIKNSKLKIIDDAGHNVMWEKPDEVNLTIKNFLEEENNGK
jgi:pimeloyl-ACP methyl ester carboxylesterase